MHGGDRSKQSNYYLLINCCAAPEVLWDLLRAVSELRTSEPQERCYLPHRRHLALCSTARACFRSHFALKSTVQACFKVIAQKHCSSLLQDPLCAQNHCSKSMFRITVQDHWSLLHCTLLHFTLFHFTPWILSTGPL